MPRRLLTIGLLWAALTLTLTSVASADSWFTLNNPIDPGQLTSLPFGDRSFWLQPWRSSLTTRSAVSLESTLGMNFNVTPSQANATARLLADSGLHRVRIELSWDGMSYANPSQISSNVLASWTTYIQAFRQYGLRPLILLNANSGLPGPYLQLSLNLTAAAAQGARTVQLDAASAAQVVPGLTGINANGDAAGVLITGVNASHVATLSQPLPTSLPAGPAAATTLRYAPFAPPTLANGSPNPRFQQTLSGWLTYVQSVSDFVRSVYGSDNFDVEVWNELSFGSDFLNEANYYNPVPDPGSTGDTDQAILAATAQTLANPANGLTDVKVGDGFANETPFMSGVQVPVGTAAIDHHPYAPTLSFPQQNPITGVAPVNALGQLAATPIGSGAATLWQDTFTPSFTSFFPEYFLTGSQTETLVRDLTPLSNNIYGVPFGAATHPMGTTAPANWITEDNLDQTAATAMGMPAADLPEFEAKAALRFYLSYASQGAQAVDLFAAAGGGCCQLIPQSFLNAASANPTGYPSDAAGGLPMQAVARMVATLAGAQSITAPRQLTLNAIASDSNTDVQFTGNGTSAFPSLYNRNVLSFFPFQVSQYKFVSAVYVMTRDLAKLYTSTPGPGQTPYDLPPENFQLTIGNVNGAHATVALTDPLTGTTQPATIVSRFANQIVVQLQATDSARMLTIDDDPANTAYPVSSGLIQTPPPVVGPTPNSPPRSTVTTTAPSPAPVTASTPAGSFPGQAPGQASLAASTPVPKATKTVGSPKAKVARVGTTRSRTKTRTQARARKSSRRGSHKTHRRRASKR